MNKEQFEQCRQVFGVPAVSVPGLMDLFDRTPRTLLLGYGANYLVHHVYIGKDGFVHVLRYAPLMGRDRASSGGYDFLVMEHTYGETGGLANVLDYVPNRRVHAAYSDFEFCSLLKSCDVAIPFGAFNEYATPRQGYQGETAGQGSSVAGLDLLGEVQEHLRASEFAGAAPGLARRLVGQAARETKTPYAVVGGGAWIHIAESGAARVLEKIAGYLFDMHENSLLHVNAEDLLFAAFNGACYLTVEGRKEHYGCVALSVQASGAVSLKAEGFSGYPDYAAGHPERALVGTYRNRPYIVYDCGEGRYNVQLSQFGDLGRFLDGNLNRGKPRQGV